MGADSTIEDLLMLNGLELICGEVDFNSVRADLANGIGIVYRYDAINTIFLCCPEF